MERGVELLVNRVRGMENLALTMEEPKRTILLAVDSLQVNTP